MKNGTKNIIKKELTRVFTDKKLILSLFILPGVLIMVMYSIMGNLIDNMVSDIEDHVPNVYIQNSPEGLEDAIQAAGFKANINYLKASDETASVQDSIKAGDTDLLVVFDENFMDTIYAYSGNGDAIPEVKTFYNPSEEYSSTARDSFVNSALQAFRQTLLAERVGNVEQLQIFYIDKVPESSVVMDEGKATGKSLSMLLPFLINILLFQGAMSLGVDAITGEKERGTLSSMLLSPIKRREIVNGKLISLAILTSLSAVIYVVSVVIGIQNLQGGSMGDISKLRFSPVELVQLLTILLVLVYLFVAVVAFVAVHARTQKEAATYVLPMYIVVMLASIMTMFSGGADKGIKYFALPIYNSCLCIQNLLVGELTIQQYGLTIGTLALLAFLVSALVTKAFNSEKVMFNA